MHPSAWVGPAVSCAKLTGKGPEAQGLGKLETRTDKRLRIESSEAIAVVVPHLQGTLWR